MRSTLGVQSRDHLLMLPDRARSLKTAPATKIMERTGASYRVVLKVPKDKIRKTREKYEKLSQDTLQAIYTGAMRKVL